MSHSATVCPCPGPGLRAGPCAISREAVYMARALSIALRICFCSSGGGAETPARAAPRLCDRAVTPPVPGSVAPAIPPRPPPPHWRQKGAPAGWRRGLGTM